MLKIKKYHQKEIRFKGVYSRDNLPKIKDEAYIINLDEYSGIRTHSIALYVQNNDVTYLIVLKRNIFQKRLEHLSMLKT